MEKWQNPETFLSWIVLIILVFVILITGVIIMTYIAFKRVIESKNRENAIIISHKNRLIQSNLDTQEKERVRFASELHDGIIGKMSAIRLQIAMNANPSILDAQIGETIDELRRISHDLHPPMYDELSLDVILLHFIQNYNEKYHLAHYFNVGTDVILPLRTKIQTLRIVQELFQNIEKHAGASHIVFLLRVSKKSMSFVLQDNGKGFQDVNRFGLGMQNIELRSNSIHGHYKFNTKSKGTTFIFYSKNDNG